jgi:hypothetical protein
MSDEESLNKEIAIKQLIAKSGLDLPQTYLDFLRKQNDYVLELEAGRFEIYAAEDVIQANEDLQVEEFLPKFFIFGGDGSNELIAFDTRETQPWKIYMIPMIVMSEEDAVVIANSFESFIQSK